MRRRILPSIVLITLLFSAGMAWSAQESTRDSEAAPFAPFPEALARDYDRLALTLQFRYRTDPVPEPAGAAR